MTVLTLTALASFAIALAAALTGTILNVRMTTEINRKKDDEEKLPYLNFPPGRRFDVFAEYRRLYPTGRLQTYILVAGIVMMIGVGGVALCLCLMGIVSPPPPSRP